GRIAALSGLEAHDVTPSLNLYRVDSISAEDLVVNIYYCAEDRWQAAAKKAAISGLYTVGYRARLGRCHQRQGPSNPAARPRHLAHGSNDRPRPNQALPDLRQAHPAALPPILLEALRRRRPPPLVLGQLRGPGGRGRRKRARQRRGRRVARMS